MANAVYATPGTQLRKSPYQNTPSEIQEREVINQLSHEQGTKVQFVYAVRSGSFLAANQSWAPVGVFNDSGTYRNGIASISVLVPQDVVVNEARFYVWLAPTQFFTAPAVSDYRQGKSLILAYDPSFSTYLVAPYLSESQQVYNGSPVDITTATFGSATLNPAQGSTAVVAYNGDITNYVVPGVPRFFNFYSSTGTDLDYYSLCFCQIIVNGYSKNRTNTQLA